MKRILLVEDEISLQETIKLNLDLEGYKVNAVGDGKSALKAFKQERFDLIVLDVMLPEMDGFKVCEAIRLDNKEVPILFLTAKNSSADKIAGLRLGADDYLTKPFNLEEMLLRVQILLKRSGLSAEVKESINSYNLDGFQINFQNMMVTTPTNKSISLTKKENALLRLLVERKNEVVSRESILEIVWGYDVYPSTRTIDNFIVTFRKLFENDPSEPKHFFSVRGVGYKFME
ncbi:MAG: response regulator transcription factor [Bacteroidota bacterium]|jgi:two-component system alkaline phosphatase synthesis response regulator PhoP